MCVWQLGASDRILQQSRQSNQTPIPEGRKGGPGPPSIAVHSHMMSPLAVIRRICMAADVTYAAARTLPYPSDSRWSRAKPRTMLLQECAGGDSTLVLQEVNVRSFPTVPSDLSRKYCVYTVSARGSVIHWICHLVDTAEEGGVLECGVPLLRTPVDHERSSHRSIGGCANCRSTRPSSLDLFDEGVSTSLHTIPR